MSFCVAGLTSWNWRSLLLRRSLCTLSLVCRTASSPLLPLSPTPEGIKHHRTNELMNSCFTVSQHLSKGPQLNIFQLAHTGTFTVMLSNVRYPL